MSLNLSANVCFRYSPAHSAREQRIPNGRRLRRLTKNMERLNIKQHMSFGKCVMVALGCYFVYVIIRANLRLQSDQIGTIFRTVSKKTVQGSYLLHKFDSELMHKSKKNGTLEEPEIFQNLSATCWESCGSQKNYYIFVT